MGLFDVESPGGPRVVLVFAPRGQEPDLRVLDPYTDLAIYSKMASDRLFHNGETEAMQDPQWRILKGVKNARAMLASGITTLRSAGEKHNLGHYLRRAIEAGWVPGPRLVLSGAPICSTGGHAWFLGVEADGPDGVRAAVRKNIKDGAEMVKMIITGGVTTPGGSLIRTCFTQPEIRAAVEEKRAVEGMDKDQVFLALGQPKHKVRETKDGQELEDWVYGTPPGRIIFVTFHDNKVIRVKETYAGLGGEVAPPLQTPR